MRNDLIAAIGEVDRLARELAAACSVVDQQLAAVISDAYDSARPEDVADQLRPHHVLYQPLASRLVGLGLRELFDPMIARGAISQADGDGQFAPRLIERVKRFVPDAEAASQPARPPVRVVATQAGFYGDEYRYVGDVFTVDAAHVSKRWMKTVAATVPETRRPAGVPARDAEGTVI